MGFRFIGLGLIEGLELWFRRFRVGLGFRAPLLVSVLLLPRVWSRVGILEYRSRYGGRCCAISHVDT